MAGRDVTYRARRVGNQPIVLDLRTCTKRKFKGFIDKFVRGNHGVFLSTFASLSSRRRKRFQLAPKMVGMVNYFDIRFITHEETLECRFLEPDFYFIAFRPLDGAWLSLNWRESMGFNVSHLEMDMLIPKINISYGALERRIKRSKLQLGLNALIKTVEMLARHRNGSSIPEINSSLLTICQMVPECARNPLLLKAVYDMFEEGGTLTEELVGLQNSFSRMCKEHIAAAIREDVNGKIMSKKDFLVVSLLLQAKFVRFDYKGALQSYVVDRADCNEEMARRLDRENDNEEVEGGLNNLAIV